MKSGTALLALISSLVAFPAALAQGQAPTRDPAAVAAPVRAPAPPPEIARRRAAAHADARVCLEFPTDLQVIACAEKYRWAKGG